MSVKISFRMSDDEFDRFEQWRMQHGFRSRSQAIRWMLHRARWAPSPELWNEPYLRRGASASVSQEE